MPRAEDLRNDVLDGVGGNREPDADVPGSRVAGLDLRVHADDLTAHVQQRPAGVAVVDRRVRLDDVVDREAVRRRDQALECANDPRGGSAIEAEWVPDRDDRIADLQLIRVAEGKRRQCARGRVHAEDGEIGGRVGADDLGLHRVAVGEAHRDDVRALDDVVVRDDVAGLVDDEARADRRLLGRSPWVARARRRGGVGGRVDADDPGRGTAVDLVHAHAAGGRSAELRARLGGRLGDDCRRRLEPSGERHRPDRDGPADHRCHNEREETTETGERRHASVIALAS